MKTAETAGRLNPFAVRSAVNSLPFEIYLPKSVLGREPDFYINSLIPDDDAIMFQQDSRTQTGGSTETLRVHLWEGTVNKSAHSRCILGQARPRECRVIVTTPLGRTVFAPYYGIYPTNLFFVINQTVIAVSAGRHHTPNPLGQWSPVEISPVEIRAFVDSFVQVDPSAVYGMKVRTGQDLE